MAHALHDTYKASYVPEFAKNMPTEPSLSDRYRQDADINSLATRKGTEGSLGGPESVRGSNVVVMTETAEEINISNSNVAF